MDRPSRAHTELVPLLARLAAEAGRLILSFSEGGLEVRSKKDESPVTNADVRAEEMLLEGLARILPGVPVLAEEQASDGKVPDTSGTFLVIDPLDGTKEYLSGRAEYTVNIGLIEGGRPCLGILAVPALGRSYRGLVGAGAARALHAPGLVPAEDAFAPIETRPLASPPLALTSRGHNDAQTEKFLDLLGAKERQRLGSAYKFALVAEGSADVYARFAGTMEWDTAAGEALLTAAGGGVRDPDGRLLRYAKTDTRFLNGPFIAWGRVPQT
ncbi:3'(2'),5'-bisphosphate nucleotidase CysQ [Terrihabitans soli]|uniref:3'(2'),5'-bisphosphate nucleotidase CysQ n=1 Tax=Terrihabitans soli TaxID=708113 RepID=A0A6S6QU19_9HYPH|nr:3'(2'),5'-bisphosphate nucleotidase CysQ [Terrihabitans soli]BCJ89968.1 3'(2'),5'-bisphosphate nucleotidase CysQ [Terrihabitans soli]